MGKSDAQTNTTSLHKEAYVGLTLEAVCAKKRAKPVNLDAKATLRKEMAEPTVQPRGLATNLMYSFWWMLLRD